MLIFLVFHLKGRCNLFILTDAIHFNMNCLKIQISLGRIDIVTSLNIPIHKHVCLLIYLALFGFLSLDLVFTLRYCTWLFTFTFYTFCRVRTIDSVILNLFFPSIFFFFLVYRKHLLFVDYVSWNLAKLIYSRIFMVDVLIYSIQLRMPSANGTVYILYTLMCNNYTIIIFLYCFAKTYRMLSMSV